MPGPLAGQPVIFVDSVTGLPIIGGGAPGPYAGFPVVSVDQNGNPLAVGIGTGGFVPNVATAGSLVFATAASKIIPGATSLSFRNAADTATNFSILNNGAATLSDQATAGGITALAITPGNHTAVAAEYVDLLYTGPTITVTASYANQRFWRLLAPTITSASPFTITSAATLEIEGGPIAAGSATIAYSKVVETHGTGVFAIESSGSTDSTHATSLHVNSVIGSSANSSFLRGIWSNNNFDLSISAVAEGVVETATITSAADSLGQYYHYPTKLTINNGITLAVVDGLHIDTPVMNGSGNAVRYNGGTIQNLGSANVTNAVGWSINDQTGSTNNTDLLIGTLTTGDWAIYSSSVKGSKLAGTLIQQGAAVVGTTLNASHALRVDLTNLTGTAQMGLVADASANTASTSTFWQIFTRTHLVASSFNVVNTAAIEIDTPVYGAGSAVTGIASGVRLLNQGAAAVANAIGINIADQSGATNANIGLLIGTAPAGTWSIYNASANNTGFVGKVTQYNNIATNGLGFPSLFKINRPAQQVNATVTLATYTTPAADGSYEISANLNLTVSTTVTMTVTCSYTDEANVARVLTLPFLLLAGTFVASITTAQGNIPYESIPITIRTKASSVITIATAGVVTAVTYTGEGIIKQVA